MGKLKDFLMDFLYFLPMYILASIVVGGTMLGILVLRAQLWVSEKVPGGGGGGAGMILIPITVGVTALSMAA